MNDDEFRDGMKRFLETSGSVLCGQLTAPSGLFRIAGVPISQYSSGFVSTNPGSFKSADVYGNWYADSWELAEKEARVKGERTYEYAEITETIPVLDMNCLPDIYRDAILQDRDCPCGCYEKSHIVLALFDTLHPNVPVSGVVFPSRRGDGQVFVYNPAQVHTNVLYSGQTPPGMDFWGKR